MWRGAGKGAESALDVAGASGWRRPRVAPGADLSDSVRAKPVFHRQGHRKRSSLLVSSPPPPLLLATNARDKKTKGGRRKSVGGCSMFRLGSSGRWVVVVTVTGGRVPTTAFDSSIRRWGDKRCCWLHGLPRLGVTTRAVPSRRGGEAEALDESVGSSPRPSLGSDGQGSGAGSRRKKTRGGGRSSTRVDASGTRSVR